MSHLSRREVLRIDGESKFNFFFFLISRLVAVKAKSHAGPHPLDVVPQISW